MRPPTAAWGAAHARAQRGALGLYERLSTPHRPALALRHAIYSAMRQGQQEIQEYDKQPASSADAVFAVQKHRKGLVTAAEAGAGGSLCRGC